MNYGDRVQETTNSLSAAVITLNGAVFGRKAFLSSEIPVGTIDLPACMVDGLGNWEIGIFTLTNATTLTKQVTLSSSNNNAAVTFPAGLKNVFSMLPASQLARIIVTSDIPFSTTIPLTNPGVAYMPQQSITGALVFSAAASPVKGALTYVRLLSNGIHTPTFVGIKEWGGSLGFDIRNGIVNQFQFFYDGNDVWYTVSQEVGAVPVASGIAINGPTSGVISQQSTAFTAFVTPTGGTITGNVVITPSDNGAGGTFTPTTVTINNAAPTAMFTYTSNSTVANKVLSFTNNGGLTNPANINYSAGLTGPVSARLNPVVGCNETGTGPYTYTGTGTNFSGAASPGGVCTTAFQSGVDGSLSFQIDKYLQTTQSEIIMGVKAVNTMQAFSAMPYTLYTQGTTGLYKIINTGTITSGNGTSLAPANGDIMRIRRINSSGAPNTASIILEVARGATPTIFTIIHTYTGVSTDVLYAQGMPAGVSSISALTGIGLA